MKNKLVTIYTTPTCKYCTVAKNYFNTNGIMAVSVDISSNKEVREMIKEKTGKLAVPVIKIGNEFIVGWKQEEVERLLGKSVV